MPALAGLDLAIILFWVGALIFCYLCVYIAKALFGSAAGAVAWIPGVGGWLKSTLGGVEQRITHTMSEAAIKCDAHIGAALHDTARLIDWLGREINRHANLLLLLAQIVTGQVPLSTIWAEIQKLGKQTRAASHAAAATGAALNPRVGGLERGIGEDVLPRIKGLEHELGDVITRDIPGIRSGIKTAERGIDNLGRWVHRHTLLAGTAAFTAAVAWALSRIGMTWARCNNVNKVGKSLCGMNTNLLESLLAGALVVASPISIVQLAESCQTITPTIYDGLDWFVREIHTLDAEANSLAG